MRKYQPIWVALKQSSTYTASIIAPEKLHRRIIQAVRKEKAKDMLWNVAQRKKGRLYKLKHSIEEDKITFYLEDCSKLSKLI